MTNLADILDPADLHVEVEAGFVKAGRHPSLPLTIFTYSRDCQYKGRWNSVTTMCRGLIVDDDGAVVGRPFPKFFNYGEHGVRDYAPPLPVEPFEVYEKVDGSLGIVFYYADRWIVASKGSFISEQAQWGQKWLDGKTSSLDTSLTYCAEMVYPSNRIVVNYGDRSDLVLLGAFHPNGTEMPLAEIDGHWGGIGSVVRRYSAPSIDDLLMLTAGNLGIDDDAETGGTDAEGFVLRLASGVRTKVKYAEYVRLHRILTGVSERNIWRALAFDEMVDLNSKAISRALKCSVEEVDAMRASPDGALATIVEGCPDEFDAWVKGVTLRLRQSYNMLAFEAKLTLARVREAVGLDDRGLFAKELMAIQNDKTLVTAVFALLDDKPLGPVIWRSLYPAASTPFVEDDEG